VLGNLAANGVWKIANVATNTFELTDPVTGTNAAGSAAYTSGGYAVCLGPGTSGDNWDDFDGALVGTAQTSTSPTVVQGVADAADVTFTSVSGASVEAFAIYKDTGTASTSRMVFFNDGRHIVTCAATAASSATTHRRRAADGRHPQRHRPDLQQRRFGHAVGGSERRRPHPDGIGAGGAGHGRLARRRADDRIRPARHAQRRQHLHRVPFERAMGIGLGHLPGPSRRPSSLLP
jgi:hypothetical protein